MKRCPHMGVGGNGGKSQRSSGMRMERRVAKAKAAMASYKVVATVRGTLQCISERGSSPRMSSEEAAKMLEVLD